MEAHKMGKKLKSDQKNILVVDDDMSVRTTFSSVLRQEGYRVTAVKNGYEAIKAIDEEIFDLALVDLRMPGMDGIEVLERIKTRRPQTRVIIFTGYGSITTVVEAMRKGAADYLNKPFPLHELKAGVKKALENGRD
jgi:DNA-binding NtrC family response regulator